MRHAPLKNLLAPIALVVVALAASEPAPATPAEKKIAAAKRVVEAGSATAQTYNDLAMALARRARETADPEFYKEALETLEKSFQIAPDNFEGKKTRVWILLGQHEFARALEEAKALNKRNADDVMVYAMLADAHVELGNYSEAETAAQWCLDLRPGNIAALTRAAYLRELFGDFEGALELMSQAYTRTPPYETEDRAWLLTHVGHLHLLSGRLRAADAALAEALRIFPDYHYALGELAKVRTAEKKHDEAVELLRRRYDAAPHPENLFSLAEALKRAGKRREARTAFRDFEKSALAESSGVDNANRELIFYYTDHAKKPREALRIAKLEMERHPNVFTRDAYAWALFANRQAEKARRELQTALAVGSRDPVLLEHARRMKVDPDKARARE